MKKRVTYLLEEKTIKSINVISKVFNLSKSETIDFIIRKKGLAKENDFIPLEEKKKKAVNSKQLAISDHFLDGTKMVNIAQNDATQGKGEGITLITKEVISYLNAKLGTRYSYKANKNQALVHARINEGATLEDFKTVINGMSKRWILDEKMKKFLRPETLFGNKFDGYLGQCENFVGREMSESEKLEARMLDIFGDKNGQQESNDTKRADCII